MAKVGEKKSCKKSRKKSEKKTFSKKSWGWFGGTFGGTKVPKKFISRWLRQKKNFFRIDRQPSQSVRTSLISVFRPILN